MPDYCVPQEPIDHLPTAPSLPAAHFQSAGPLFSSWTTASEPPSRPAPTPSTFSIVSAPHVVASSARIPRSSSLLPPARFTLAALQSPAPDASPILQPPIDFSQHSATPPRQPGGPVGRGGGAGAGANAPASSAYPDDGFSRVGLDDSLADQTPLPSQQPHPYRRHRWSASTGSSRTSVFTQQRTPNTRSDRRASVDATVSLTESPPPPRPSLKPSPRKLQKARRPSFASISQAAPSTSPASAPPLPSSLQTAGGILPHWQQRLGKEASPINQPGYQDSQRHYELLAPIPSLDPISVSPIRDTMSLDQGRDQTYPTQGHSRSRSGKGSNDSLRARNSKPPSQKAMLSRALQKANTAVQLDNAQNFLGARQAYAEACDLLQHVLQRTSADEDKRKLEAIRRTYTSRIDELDQMGLWQGINAKALPARPESVAQRRNSVAHFDDEDAEDDVAIIETAIFTRIPQDEPRVEQPTQTSSRPTLSVHTSGPGLLQSSFSKSPVRIRPPMDISVPRSDSQYITAPLSPFRPSSPLKPQLDEPNPSLQSDTPTAPPKGESRVVAGHIREDSQNSWLDPIDESGGSTSSSIRSRTSSFGYRRRHVRSTSGATELEFDTALDAAIEAAYDEGYEPMEPNDYESNEPDEEIVANALRKVEIARERVRQTEREAYEVANELGMGRQIQRHQQQPPQLQPQQLVEPQPPLSAALNSPQGFYDENSSDDEERLLEEMTRDYSIEDFTLRQQAALTTDGHTDSSSRLNQPPTAPKLFASTLSQPPMPPPSQSVPDIPMSRQGQPVQSVRNRRLSGQNLKQLKIETSIANPQPLHASQAVSQPRAIASKSELDVPPEEDEDAFAASGRPSSPLEDFSPTDPRPLGSPFGHRGPFSDPDGDFLGHPASPGKIHKNFSSSSLKSMKGRSMSLSNADEASDLSPGTPSSHYFSHSRAPAVPALPTPLATTFRERMDGISAGGIYLFDDNFHSPTSPGSPNPLTSDAPISLEPCPTDFMLRPFWLMRCLYQTLVHPRGGYLSTKLFVPREVWRVKGVKLRNVEDKVANCDYLTAALLKLAKVDTYDADAVLEEMQSLEGVLEEIQASLTRKLGNEVGVQGSGQLFKENAGTAEGSTPSTVPRSGSVSGKSSSSFSWRRLRSKNSAAGLSGGTNGTRTVSAGAVEASKDVGNLPTLPMTPNPTSRPAKRDVAQAQFMGPNANYMGSLARLFDAAQVIDQIARQVEDPGLRHADKTQVGLELCTRHAAEFFGFYICRFVLADLNMLIEKFIKRGSEWVLA